ncbi:MAG: hypothetical protein ACK55I_13105, partial [bacterium]
SIDTTKHRRGEHESPSSEDGLAARVRARIDGDVGDGRLAGIITVRPTPLSRRPRRGRRRRPKSQRRYVDGRL